MLFGQFLGILVNHLAKFLGEPFLQSLKQHEKFPEGKPSPPFCRGTGDAGHDAFGGKHIFPEKLVSSMERFTPAENEHVSPLKKGVKYHRPKNQRSGDVFVFRGNI